MSTQSSLLQQLRNRLQRNESNKVMQNAIETRYNVETSEPIRNYSQVTQTQDYNQVTQTQDYSQVTQMQDYNQVTQTQDSIQVLTLWSLISQSYQKNQNLIKFVFCFLVFLMYPLLIFFPVFYYLVRHFTNDTKYVSILVLMFTVLVTNGVLGTLYIILVLLALTLMWNYENIYFILDLFTPVFNNKVKGITTLSNIYVNKSMQNKFVTVATNKLSQILNSVNNDKQSKLGQTIAYCEMASNWVFVLIDFILENIVAHLVILLTESIESLTQKIIERNIQISNSVESVNIHQNSLDICDIIPPHSDNINNNNSINLRSLSQHTSSPSYTPTRYPSPSATSTYQNDNDISNVIPTYSTTTNVNAPIRNFNLITSENIDEIFKNCEPSVSASYKQTLVKDIAMGQEYNTNQFNSNFLDRIDNEYADANNMLSSLKTIE